VEIEAIKGDITKLAVDVVVNAANEALAGGGGVDGAIHRAAGIEDLQEACARLGGCRTGDAKLTPGFDLPARWIAHAVGPRWRGGGEREAELLASCYRRVLVLCDEVGARSVAFPAISTGVYGYPAQEAADIAVRTLRETPTKVERVVLVAFDDAMLRVLQAAMR
jgi:O-acetyl-ADP-ribose deacetylase (regulator of RNase III)